MIGIGIIIDVFVSVMVLSHVYAVFVFASFIIPTFFVFLFFLTVNEDQGVNIESK